MPWRWLPPKNDPSLKVYRKKPDGIAYKCHWCKGWIEGEPIREHEDTIGPLSGREGTVEYCRRCGLEIGFFGMVS